MLTETERQVECRVTIHLNPGKTFADFERLEARMVPKETRDRARSTYAVTSFPGSNAAAKHVKKVIKGLLPTKRELELDQRIKKAVEDQGIGSVEIKYVKRRPKGGEGGEVNWMWCEGLMTEEDLVTL